MHSLTTGRRRTCLSIHINPLSQRNSAKNCSAILRSLHVIGDSPRATFARALYRSPEPSSTGLSVTTVTFSCHHVDCCRKSIVGNFWLSHSLVWSWDSELESRCAWVYRRASFESENQLWNVLLTGNGTCTILTFRRFMYLKLIF